MVNPRDLAWECRRRRGRFPLYLQKLASCAHVCLHECMHACRCASTHAHTHTCTCTHTHTNPTSPYHHPCHFPPSPSTSSSTLTCCSSLPATYPQYNCLSCHGKGVMMFNYLCTCDVVVEAYLPYLICTGLWHFHCSVLTTNSVIVCWLLNIPGIQTV